ncbi:MAG: threonylcarbamoyl-AMP synthase [Fibrobacterales bacterium]|nr:threonylcarbamoyl-AMP synthase [Fibrobacterales bacterium]
MQIIEIHPVTPQVRLVKQVAEVFQEGGVVIYPTVAGYAIGCDANNKKAIKRLYAVKGAIKKPLMALMFKSISDMAPYAKVDNFAYRVMKDRVPGPYTFILPAQVHIARLLDVKRLEVGVRVPCHPFLLELHNHWAGPILNTGARLHDDEDFTDPEELEKAFRGKADLLVSCGEIAVNPTNVVRLVDGVAEVIRGEL